MSEHSLCEGMQSAYKAGHCNETALVRVKNDILTSMDKNQCAGLDIDRWPGGLFYSAGQWI